MARAKSPFGKTRKKEDPYEVWAAPGWEWRVLKKYSADDNAPYARAFCFVFGPGAPGGEFGDCYIKDYTSRARRVK